MQLDDYLKTNRLSFAAFARQLLVSDEAVRQWATKGKVPKRSLWREIEAATGGAVTAVDWSARIMGEAA